MQLVSFLFFTLLVAIISYFATRKTKENTSDGYFLGGRSLTGVVIAGSLLLTNLSTEQIVGLNGTAFKDGILVMAWETLAAIAMVVTALVLLPRYLKGGITTVPQFLERRYDKATKTITSGLFLSGYVVVLLPIVLYSGRDRKRSIKLLKQYQAGQPHPVLFSSSHGRENLSRGTEKTP